jgi:hypothetical protein
MNASPQSPDWEYRPDEGQWRLGWQLGVIT